MSFLRPTLKDVAKLSGVSEISVSRVMRNAPNISSRLREKVEAAALELHYTPNKVAGALASNTTDLIGVVIPTLKKRGYTQILSGIESVLSQSRYRMMLGVSDFSSKRETKVMLDLLSWSPSGIIMVGTGHSDDTYELLERSQAQLVEVLNEDREPAEFGLSFTYQKAIKDLVDHWMKQGYKNIVYIEANEGRIFPENFRDHLKKQLETRGMSLVNQVISDKPSSVAGGIALCNQVAQQAPEVDVIFFAGENFVLDATVYYSAKLPSNIALASFGQGADDEKSIDLIQLPFEKIGANAAKLFLNGATNIDPTQIKTVKLPAAFLCGAGCS